MATANSFRAVSNHAWASATTSQNVGLVVESDLALDVAMTNKRPEPIRDFPVLLGEESEFLVEDNIRSLLRQLDVVQRTKDPRRGLSEIRDQVNAATLTSVRSLRREALARFTHIAQRKIDRGVAFDRSFESSTHDWFEQAIERHLLRRRFALERLHVWRSGFGRPFGDEQEFEDLMHREVEEAVAAVSAVARTTYPPAKRLRAAFKVTLLSLVVLGVAETYRCLVNWSVGR